MEKFIRTGFILAGLTNISGVLLFSAAFTNPYMVKYDPLLFNSFGLLMIILWGLAYIATANTWRMMRLMVAVFAIEKLAYGWAWVLWMSGHSEMLPAMFEESFLTGLFFSIYGVIDLTFCAFFSFAWWVARRPSVA